MWPNRSGCNPSSSQHNGKRRSLPDRDTGEPLLTGKDILKFSLLALLFLGLVAAWLGFGERGFIHLYRMDRERQAYLERINKPERENRELLEEIQRLRSDREYVENLGRRELGLVKEDEVMYRFGTKKEKTKQ